MSQAVIVTGSGGGIGQAICQRFRDADHYVVGFDKVESKDADEWVEIDLANLQRVREVTKEISNKHPVGVVVHNAAIQPLAAAGDTSDDCFIEVLRVNVLAADALVNAAGASLARHDGSVVVVSSVHAQVTTAGINAYATSKAALEGWVRSAAIDLAPDVRVNAVRPGAINTAKLRDGFDRWGRDVSAERWAMLEARTPLGRVGASTDVAAAVYFLAGAEAGFITGTTLVVDGGASARLSTE
ncbi:SDR family NAD(P)-dependent oxidoreductase [Mycolicibacterium pulveris]|uniref:SDR family NAD(P)-dependent oxidoreductase n=1 Tax=Mycolicibacterium pulveris TaxID=36813 RepID=UPI003CF769CF